MIGRLAELDPADVVLEVGPGLGVLTGYLAERTAPRARRRARPLARAAPREALGGRDNVELHFGDALQLDLAALEPAPTKLVSNLPYNIATPLVVESLDGLPSLELWCVMVQREVADRFFAQPSTKAYGAVSVLVQLAAERTGFHPVSRDGLPAAAERRLRARRLPARELPPDFAARQAGRRRARSPTGARRSPNSLELAGPRDPRAAAAALEAIGRDPGVRAEELAPAGVRRPRRGARPMRRAPATAKLNLALVVGPRATTAATRWRPCSSGSTSPTGSRSSRRRALAVEGFAEDTLVRARARERSPTRPASSRAGARGSRSTSRSRRASAAAAPTRRPRSASQTRRSPSRSRRSACTSSPPASAPTSLSS